mgnify:CR=1 FL=1
MHDVHKHHDSLHPIGGIINQRDDGSLHLHGAAYIAHFHPHPESYKARSSVIGSMQRSVIEKEIQLKQLQCHGEAMSLDDCEFMYVKNLELLSDPDYLKQKSEENGCVLDRGNMKAVVMILWAARNVFLECLAGCSFLCRVMSAPDENAWL